MNFGRIAAAAVVAWIVSLGLGFFVNDVLLAGIAAANAAVMRPEAELMGTAAARVRVPADRLLRVCLRLCERIRGRERRDRRHPVRRARRCHRDRLRADLAIRRVPDHGDLCRWRSSSTRSSSWRIYGAIVGAIYKPSAQHRRAASGIRSTDGHAEKAKGGLEDVVATSSAICYLDGDRGVLAYCGYDIHDLAKHATFEEVCYLLWHRRLPTRAELGDLQSQLAAARPLPEPIHRLMRSLPPVDGMDALRTLTSALAHYDPEVNEASPPAATARPSASPRRSARSSPPGAACTRAAGRSSPTPSWGTPRTSSTCSPASGRMPPPSARSTSR